MLPDVHIHQIDDAGNRGCTELKFPFVHFVECIVGCMMEVEVSL
jgi:hypothetical protein